jgi:hypothetical protein
MAHTFTLEINMSALTTPEQIDAFRCILIHKAISLYLKTGMQVNRMYTPANMRRVASEYTGMAYPRSRKGLEQAEQDLATIVARVKAARD